MNQPGDTKHKFVRFAAISYIRLSVFNSLEKLEHVKLINKTKKKCSTPKQNHKENKDFEGLLKDTIFFFSQAWE